MGASTHSGGVAHVLTAPCSIFGSNRLATSWHLLGLHTLQLPRTRGEPDDVR